MNKDQAKQAMRLGLRVRLEWWQDGAYRMLDEQSGRWVNSRGYPSTVDLAGCESDDWQIYNESGDTFTAEQAEFLLLEAGERVGLPGHGWFDVFGGAIRDEEGARYLTERVFMPNGGPYTIIPREPSVGMNKPISMSDKPRFDVVKEKDETWSIYTRIGVAYCRVSGPHTERQARLFANAEEMAAMLRRIVFDGIGCGNCAPLPAEDDALSLLARIEGAQ